VQLTVFKTLVARVEEVTALTGKFFFHSWLKRSAKIVLSFFLEVPKEIAL
jgi:hypothetical protein